MRKKIWINRIFILVIMTVIFLFQYSILIFAVDIISEVEKEIITAQEIDIQNVGQKEQTDIATENISDILKTEEILEDSVVMDQKVLEDICFEEGKSASESAIKLLNTAANLDLEGFLYHLNGNVVVITGYNGEGVDVIIPEEINGYSVTEIGSRAFSDCSNIKSIVLPKSIQIVGSYAFSNCDSLESVDMEENGGICEVVFESGAFSECPKLSQVNFSSDVSSLGEYLFSNCRSLSVLQLPENVKVLGESMLKGTKITSITIPKKVERIIGSNYRGPLAGCETLKEVIFEEEMKKIPDYIASTDDSTKNHIEKVKIPNGVTEIGVYAFYNCGEIINIELPQTLEKIGNMAFESCRGLKSISLPESLKEIGGRAFANCNGIEKLSLSKSIQIVRSYAFSNCDSLESVDMEENGGIYEVVFESGAFSECPKLSQVNFSSDVSSLGEYLFSNCRSLSVLQLPENVKVLGESMLKGTKITSITIPKKVERIIGSNYRGPLAGCETLKEVIFEEEMKKIPDYIVSSDNSTKIYIEKVVIPSSVNEIGANAFYNCSKITIYGYKNSYAEIYANEQNIPFKTVAISKDSTAEQILMKLSLDSLIKNINIKGNKMDGPDITIGNQTFPLFSVDVGLEMKLGDAVQAKVDTETKTIQVLIGFKDFSGSASLSEADNKTNYWSESYKQVKDLYTGMTGKKVDTTQLWNNFSKLRGKLRKVNGLKMGIDGKASVAGYMEFSYSSGEIVFSQGGIIAEIGLGTSFEYKIPPFPIAYLTFGARVDADAKISLIRESAYCYAPAANLGLGLGANIGVGVGEKKVKTYVEGGLKGSLKFGLTLPSETFAKAFSAKLTGKVYFESKILGFDGPAYTKDFDDIILYPKTVKGIEPFEAGEEGMILDVTQMSPISRDYLYLTGSMLSEIRVAKPNIILTLTNQYPYNEARIACLEDGSKFLVWVGDMGNKSNVNKTSLCYSVYDGIKWSEPQITSDTGGLNDYPYIVSDGKTVYIVWQKTTSAMSDNASLEEVLKSTDLYFMTYQNGKFSEAVKITEDNSVNYEMFHSLAICRNQIVVAWVENSENDPFMLKGTNCIKKAIRKNGRWIVSTVAENLGQIDNCIAINCKGEPGILYECNSRIYVVTDSETITLQGRNAQVEKNLLYYEADGKMLVYDFIVRQSRETGLSAFGTTYTITTLDDNPVISAVNYTGFTSELVAYRYDKVRGNWSELIRLSDDLKYIRSYQMTQDKDKNLIAVFNLVDVTEEAEDIYHAANIQVMNFMEGHDLILENVWYEENQVIPNKELPILFEVKNNSIEKVSKIHAAIVDERGSIFTQTEIPVELQPGEIGRFSLSYLLPDTISCHKIKLIVEAEDEVILQDNEKELTIGNADISIKEVTLSGTWAEASLIGKVENIGYRTAEEVSVKIYAKHSEEEIIVIDEISLGTISAGKEKDFVVIIPEEYRQVDSLAFGNDIYIEVFTSTEQTQFHNDLVKYVIYSELEAPLILNKPELTLKEGETGLLYVSYSASGNTEVEWSSSNLSIATVEDGHVKAVSAGIAEITAKVNGKSVSCNVIVENKQTVNVEGIYAQKQSVTLKKGESVWLQATVFPSNATNKTIDWSSDNVEIVEVNDGEIKGVALGEAVITARTEDGNKVIQYQISVVQEQNFQDTDSELESNYQWGDINRDGIINSIDAVLTLNYASRLVQLDKEQQRLADVNGDGRINSTDAVLILNKASSNISSFPGER